MKIHVRQWRWVNSAVFTGGPAWLVQRVWSKCWKMGCGKILFLHRSQEGNHKAGRTGSGLCIYLCHTHIFKGRHTLPESLSFPALYAELPLIVVWKCQSFPGGCEFVCVNVFFNANRFAIDDIKPYNLKHTSLFTITPSLSGFIFHAAYRNEWDVIPMSAVQYEGPIPVLITAECWLTVCV